LLWHALATLFARRAVVEPELGDWPGLQRALLFGPLSPISFSLQGPDALDDAAARTLQAAETFGAICGSQLEPEERGLFDMIRNAKKHAA
jgi:dimethylaniline monooxygenase (N-oxide forming)